MLDVNIDCLAVLVLLQNHELRVLYNLLGSFPFKVLELRGPLRDDSLILEELTVGAGKLRVCPLLARMIDQPLKDRVLLLIILSHGIIILLLLICQILTLLDRL